MNISDIEYQDLSEAMAGGACALVPNMNLLRHVNVELEVKLGEASLTVAELFALKAGSVVALDRGVDEVVDVLLNGKVVAVGQLAVCGDQLGVRITAINNETQSPS